MTNEIIEHTAPQQIHDDPPLTAEQIHAQVQLIQRVMMSEMQDKVHYGTIPGCGDRPALLKAGAEKLCMTFRMAPKYEIEDLGTDGERRYLIRAKLYSMKHGIFLGEGIGEASTLEDKYAWEKATDAEYDDEVDPTRKRIKHYRDYDQKQVRANVADRSNTVLKMGKKRALVDAVLTVTAASDMFTQDLDEDDVADMARQQAKEQAPAQKPKAKAPPAPKVPFGNYKDKHIDDPAVPLAELEYLAGSTARGLEDPKRAKFKAQNQIFLAALDAEIARRTNAPGPGQAPAGQAKESTRAPMPDTSWAEFARMATEKWQPEADRVFIELGVQGFEQVELANRWVVFDRINALVSQ